MKTVMIVEDELPARELLKMAIDWEKAGYRITAEAKNGQEAYEKYKEAAPDIIITDIQMPVMNGIELIEKIKKINNDQAFIILSCHESFFYAQRALRLGVKDYLIKDSYSSTELYELLNMLTKNSNHRIGDANVGKKMSFVAAISIHGFNDKIVEEKIETILKILNEEFGFETEVKFNSTIYFHGVICGNNSLLENINLRHELVCRVQLRLEKELKTLISIGCSNIILGEECLKSQMEDASKALNYTVFLGKGKIAFFEGITDSHKIVEVSILNKRIREAIKFYEVGNQADLKKMLDQIYQHDINGIAQYHYLEYVNSIFYSYINQQISQNEWKPEKVWGNELVTFTKLMELDTVDGMEDWIFEHFNRLLGLVHDSEHYSEYVRNAISFVKENYNKDINIEEIANYIGIHKVYLNRIFKKETGSTVNSFINSYRISEAISLLIESKCKIAEVIWRVGFNSEQNFYYTFRQVTGMSPNEYLKTKGNR